MANSYREFSNQVRGRQRRRAQRRVLSMALLAVMVLSVSGVITWGIQAVTGWGAEEPATSETVQPGISGSVLAPLPMQNPVVDTNETGFERMGPVQQTGDYTIKTLTYEDIIQPECGLVDSTKYLPDVVFLGDSVTEGLDLYENPAKGVATVLGYRGAVPSDIVNRKSMNRYQSETVVATEVALDIIAQKQPKAVYLMFGANALATSADEAVEKGYFGYYEQMITSIREAAGQDVQIYIQSMTPVTTDYTNTNLNNERIQRINQQLAQMALEQGCHYLDVYSSLLDDSGGLNPSYTTEGLHLNSAGYGAWMDYLLRHVAYSSDLPYVMGSTYYLADNA